MGPGFPGSLSSLQGTEAGCFVSFNHNVNSELEDAKKKPFRGKWERLGRAGPGRRADEMKTRSLRMKQKTAGGEKSLAESPDEKAGVSVKLGSSRKKRGKTDPGNFLQKYLWG